MDYKEHLQKAAEAIKKSDAVLITAGAGLGVDSGLPDFRGDKGFWKAYPPIAKLGISFVDMANPHWFEADPQLAWAFYGHRKNLYKATEPHRGFQIMLNWAKEKKHGYFVFTSNVDGHFQKAGFNKDAVYEVHGSINHFQCTKPCSYDIWAAHDVDINIDMETFQAQEPLPKCPNCGGLARPNVLMFGDWHWVDNRSAEQSRRFHDWLNELEKNNTRLVIIESGAGKAVPTVRFESESVFRKNNADFIRINPRDYEVPDGAISLPMGTLEALEAIDRELT